MRGLVWFHRWSGIFLSLFFALWFASGAILAFIPFPSLPEATRLAKAETIDMTKLTVTPATLPELGLSDHDVRLISLEGRPTYLGTSGDGTITVIHGDDGSSGGTIDRSTALQLAKRFSSAPVERILGPDRYDQWIVHQHFDPYRPFYRVFYDDDAHQRAYISSRTGEVLQVTTRSQRAWNYCGAVLHWIYFTPIRADWSFWNQLVWWLSLIAVVVAGAGFWLGVVRLLQVRRNAKGKLTPFRHPLMAWHHILGLFFGVALLTWMVSGWLSMDHGRLFSKGQPSPGEIAAMRGMSRAAVVQAVPFAQMKTLGTASEVRFFGVAGQAFILARDGRAARIYPAGESSPPLATLPDPIIASAVAAAWPKTPIARIEATEADSLDSLAEGLPSGTRLVQLADRKIYFDPILGHASVVMDQSRELYAWVYYGLHTFNFPGLASRPLLRHGLEFLLLSGGLALSITSIAVGIRRLRRAFS